MRPVLFVSLLGACASADPALPSVDTGPGYDVPCPTTASPTLELAHADDPWGIEGVELGCGIPPQGGAPYTRLQVRVSGSEALTDGAQIEVVAEDAETGELLGSTAVTAGFVCANVGDNADRWVTSEVHLRYDGFSVEGLVGREVELSASVTAGSTVITTHGWGTLTPL